MYPQITVKITQPYKAFPGMPRSFLLCCKVGILETTPLHWDVSAGLSPGIKGAEPKLSTFLLDVCDKGDNRGKVWPVSHIYP